MSGRTQDWRCWCSSFVMVSVLIASLQEQAFAQITPDTSLPNNSSVARDGNIFNITGGTKAGSNLFHSFGEFSVPLNGAALFNNAADIQNIISRVTGGSVSNIYGIIRTNNANLFLINPNGIVFGANARLNIGGSFVASTANALQFENIGFFSATDKNIPSPLLTINPSALLFNQINQNAGIKNYSVAPARTNPAGFDALGLRVPDGKSLLLVGGNVSMDKGRLNAYGGRVELGGLAEPGSVALGVDGDNLSLKFPENVTRADIYFTNSAGVFVEAAGGGNIAVNAKNLEILGGSILSAGIGQGLGTSETVAGDIALNATGEIKVAGTGSNVANLVRLGSQGNGGNITIDSGSFSLRDDAELTVSTFGQGNAGNVTVRARDAVFLADAGIFSAVSSGGVGKGGNIDINAATLSLIDGAQLITATREAHEPQPPGRGDAGNVNINVTGKVDIAGEKNSLFSVISSNMEMETVGNGGNISINSGSFSLRDGAGLTVSTSGQGNAGNVSVRARDAVSLSNNAAILSIVDTGGVGKGGNIDINTVTLSLIDGASLQTSTYGKGNAGNVSVQAQNAVSLADNAGIFSTVSPEGVGKGGNIDINAATLSLIDGASLQTSTYGKGNAGNVAVRARDAVSLADDAGIFSIVSPEGVGKGGNIDINAAILSLTDGAMLEASTTGQGNAGNVTVQVRDAVSLAYAVIFSTVESSGVGKGGNIDINAATLSLTDGAQLLTYTDDVSDRQLVGRGDAGNVNLNVTGAVDITGQKNNLFSGIGSFVETGTEGNGGNITIDSGSFSLRDGAQLTASTSGLGNAGNVTVIARDAVSLADNAAILSTVESGGVGKGGNIDINAARLSLTDGGQLLTITRGVSDTQAAGQGDAGNVNVNVTGAVDIAGEKNSLSGIGSFVELGTQGNGGKITIDSGSFSLRERAQLEASTSGQGNAGTIQVNTADFFAISGSSSDLNTGLFVNSQSPTGTAGDIIVTSPKVTLDNSGRLNAESASGNGGNINLQTDLLLLRRGAGISTTAGTAQAGGNGGNITITAPNGFILAVPSENSDITANAFTGSGGRVDIKAFGIYGIEFRDKENPQTSDITASSKFGIQGTVELNTPDIDPNSGLVELPTIPVDTKLAQGCYSPGSAQNRFVITGRGGLPPNPKDILTPDTPQIDWVSLKPSSNNRSLPPVTSEPTTSTPKRIVEATGATLNAKGQIVLSANSSTATLNTSRQNPIQCHGS
ncbi:two-partner secretion domain-containing protein [Nostoc sp.]|uniref:two-partner secretion domain-containing protein n=1 Tax=Nostoc sp. TaxID=1180 RepID=UPI002FF4E6F8